MKSEELQQQIDDLDAKATELKEAEAEAEAIERNGPKMNMIRGQRLGLDQRRRALVEERDQALTSEAREQAEANKLIGLRADHPDIVASLESDVASIQAKVDAILAGFVEVDTEIKALVAQMRDVVKQADGLHTDCATYGIAPPRVQLTPTIRAFGKLGSEYKV